MGALLGRGAWVCVVRARGSTAPGHRWPQGRTMLWCLNKERVCTQGERRKRAGSRCRRTPGKNDPAAAGTQQELALHSPWKGHPEQMIHSSAAWAQRTLTPGCPLQPRGRCLRRTCGTWLSGPGGEFPGWKPSRPGQGEACLVWSLSAAGSRCLPDTGPAAACSALRCPPRPTDADPPQGRAPAGRRLWGHEHM